MEADELAEVLEVLRKNGVKSYSSTDKGICVEFFPESASLGDEAAPEVKRNPADLEHAAVPPRAHPKLWAGGAPPTFPGVGK